MAMGIFSSAFAFSRLCKPGVSLEVRQLILKRHVAYIIFYFTCNLYLLIQETEYYIQKNKHGTVATGTWWINLTEVLYFSQGIMVPSLRLLEPYFFQQAWRNTKSGFKRVVTVLLCRKYNVEVYDPTVVGAKFVNKEDVL